MNPLKSFFKRKRNDTKISGQPEAQERKEMIKGIEHLSETTVKEVMVPRTDTVFLQSDSSQEAIFKALVDSGHSRIPVYRETIDDVTGILYSKDVLAALIHKKDISLSSLVRKPFFVPETKKIDSLLREFKRKRVHIAVVVDEYGGTAGIVCMEDIIEEIVGEIQDEFDNESEPLIQIGPRIWLCDAKTRLDEIASETGIDLPEDEFDSLAGYVFDLFGRIPTEKEHAETTDAIFSVHKMEAHRIISVRIEKKDENTTPEQTPLNE